MGTKALGWKLVGSMAGLGRLKPGCPGLCGQGRAGVTCPEVPDVGLATPD